MRFIDKQDLIRPLYEAVHRSHIYRHEKSKITCCNDETGTRRGIERRLLLIRMTFISIYKAIIEKVSSGVDIIKTHFN